MRPWAGWLIVAGCSQTVPAIGESDASTPANASTPADASAPAGPEAGAHDAAPPYFTCPNGCPDGGWCVVPDNSMYGVCNYPAGVGFFCGTPAYPPGAEPYPCAEGLVCLKNRCEKP